MKNLKNVLKRVTVALLAVILMSTIVPPITGVDGISLVAEAATVKLSANSLTLFKGQNKVLKVSGTKNKVTWISGNSKVASVKKGKVVAIKKGKTTILAKVGKKTYKCVVTVEDPKLSKTSVTLDVGGSTTLTLSGTKQSVKWTSSAKNVASVNSKGKITALKEGKTTITATSNNKKFTCNVRVNEVVKEDVVVNVSNITLNQTMLSIYVGDKAQLTATLLPSNATDKTVKWTSSNSSIAYVSSTGEVTAIGDGNATIIAESGGKTATCTVSVSTKKLTPDFTARMFANYTYDSAILIIIQNNGTKPMVLADYVLLQTNGVQYNLYTVNAQAVFVYNVVIQPGETASVPLCQKSYGKFYMSTSSICAFSFAYDGIMYIAGTNYYGSNTLYEEMDTSATSLNMKHVSEEAMLSECIFDLKNNQEANSMDIFEADNVQSKKTIDSLVEMIDNIK